MDFNAIADVVLNNGVGLACVIYILYFNSKVNDMLQESYKENTSILKEISENLIKMNERMNNLEESIKDLKK